jgi:hypothetical protein
MGHSIEEIVQMETVLPMMIPLVARTLPEVLPAEIKAQRTLMVVPTEMTLTELIVSTNRTLSIELILLTAMIEMPELEMTMVLV